MSLTTSDRGQIVKRLEDLSHHWSAKIAEWQAASQVYVERSHAQPFWSDLLRAFDVIPERIDLFERDAQRATTGGRGYIDFFWSGVAIGEAKSLGLDLDHAHKQALDYLSGGSVASHEFPKYVIVTNFGQFRIDRLGDDAWTVCFDLEDLPSYVDQLMFLAGHETVTKQEQDEASVVASQVMADLYTAMVGEDSDLGVGDQAPQNPEDEELATQQASVFMTRLLFLLYGDDAGLWEEDLFYRFVLYDTTPANLGSQLQGLFEVLNRPENQRKNVPDAMAKFPYVNGALFAGPAPVEFLTEEMRDRLLAACRFRWTKISPALFGSMFQMVKSKEARGHSGEHYTTEENILKTLGPLFLDEFQSRADRLIKAKSTTQRQLRDFQDELAAHQFLDPACGSGNFLNVAYAELREIEKRVLVALRTRSGRTMDLALDVSLTTKVTIDQFHGFEINWWPAKIAETAMFLVDHQANRALAAALGHAPDRLPISITAHIHHTDALTADWAALMPSTAGTTYVFGNPPFLGKSQRDQQQTAVMKEAWGADYSGEMDFVTAWAAKSAALLDQRRGRFAFVMTSSAFQGISARALVGPLIRRGWHIDFAHQPFDWSSEVPGAAHVHVSIAGFCREESSKRKMYRYASAKGEPSLAVVANISPYLIAGPNILVKDRRTALNPTLSYPMSFGAMAADAGSKRALGGTQGRPQGLIIGPLDIEEAEADPVAAPYVRKFVGARELIRGERRWCIWMPVPNAAAIQGSPFLKRRVENVRKGRAEILTDSEVRAAADRPYAFMRPNKIDAPYLCIPRHFSQERRFMTAVELPADVVAGDATVIVEDPDGLLFALLSSSMFMAWQRLVGGRIRNDLRFASEVTWNTWPAPDLQSHRADIIAAGRKILSARTVNGDQSLGTQYDSLAMAAPLLAAHAELDRLVDTAFGATRRLTTEQQRQEILFQRYVEMTSGG